MIALDDDKLLNPVPMYIIITLVHHSKGADQISESSRQINGRDHPVPEGGQVK